MRDVRRLQPGTFLRPQVDVVRREERRRAEPLDDVPPAVGDSTEDVAWLRFERERVQAALRQLSDELRADNAELGPELSMGMSDDFEIAVEEGATIVRVGRALFGERPVQG